MYSYISDIDKTDLFIYGSVIIAAITLTLRINPSFNVVVGLLCGLTVVYYVNEKKNSTEENFIKKMDNILASDLLKPHKNKFLYKDTTLIEFLDTHREYKQYNPALYNTLVQTINSFLILLEDIELNVKRYNLDYQTMLGLQNKALNIYHSFIHTLPHTQNSLDKYHDGMEKLEGLLNIHIDTVHREVARRNSKEITISTTFPLRNQPKPLDTFHEAQYHYFT